MHTTLTYRQRKAQPVHKGVKPKNESPNSFSMGFKPVAESTK